MSQPTIGALLHFRYNKTQTEPHPAFICHVVNEREVTVAGFTANGTPFQQPNVRLLQDADPVPQTGIYAVWPEEDGPQEPGTGGGGNGGILGTGINPEIKL